MSYVLVIDTGSSSMRGILFDESGRMRFTEQRRYTMRTRGDAAEYDPADFRRCLTEICRVCADQGAGIAALSFTSQRSSILPVAADGQPLGPIITWYDKRAAGICADLNARCGKRLYELAGMKATPVLSAPKIAWLRQNQPEIYAAAHKIIGIQDYLIYLCTGRFVTDTSLASRTHLMNIRTRAWDGELLDLYGVDADRLAELVAPCTAVGGVTRAFSQATGIPAGVPVVTGGGDQQCSVLGQGLTRPGALGLTCGSGAYLAAVSDAPLTDGQMRVNVNAAISPGQWVIEASALSSGTVQDWLNRTFYGNESGQSYPLERLHAEAAQSPAGARGLLMLPDLAGKGCPDWNDAVRGAFLNVSFAHTRADFARAMLEGLAAEIAECYDVLRGLLPAVHTVSATGGVTKCALFNQIVADMIDFPVKKCANMETTAIGAYLAACYALGTHASLEQAFQSLPAAEESSLFAPEAQAVSRYRALNAARRGVYQALAACPLPAARE